MATITAETKLLFVEMRADGKGYRAIAQELKISRDTCTKLSRELTAEIDAARAERVRELQAKLEVTREGRLNRLGEVQRRLVESIAAEDLSKIPLVKRIELLLKVEKLLKEDSRDAHEPIPADLSGEAMTVQTEALLNRVRLGEINARQALQEMRLLKDSKSSLTSEENPWDIFD